MNVKAFKINWHWVFAILSLGIFALAITSLYHTLKHIDIQEVKSALAAIPTGHLVLGLAIVGLAYLILSLYDWLALKYLKLKVPYSRITFASLTAYAVGHSVGLAAFSAGAVRYRLYSVVGLTPMQIAAVMVMVSVTFTFGITTMAGITVMLRPDMLAQVLPFMSEGFIRFLGGVTLLTVFGVMLWSGPNGRRLVFRKWACDMPTAKMLMMQTGASVLDIVTAAAALYVLLPSGVTYMDALTAFVMSMVIGILSHVPGGVGVFEATMLMAFPDLPKPELVATLVVFRIFYYLLPFAIAMLLLVANEGWQHSGIIKQALFHKTGPLAKYVPEIILALVAILFGLIVLVSFAVAHSL